MLMGIDGEVTSLYLVVELLVGGDMGTSKCGWCDNSIEIPMSVACLTQRLFLVLIISYLLGSRGDVSLLCLFTQSLASINFCLP
jgi:hypothetical protein